MPFYFISNDHITEKFKPGNPVLSSFIDIPPFLGQFIADYSTPDGKSLSRDLTQQINVIIQFLVECRPLSVSMGNAIKYLKLKLSKVWI